MNTQTFSFRPLNLVASALVLLGVLATGTAAPNVVLILCDDLGIGDVQTYGTGGKIPTPNIDRLAKEGMRFTDAHTTSSVCTPTRYSLLTGRYHWRSKLQRGVLGGLSPRLIEPGRATLASMLKAKGYHTACIGKWHLGMNWVVKPGREVNELGIETTDQHDSVDYSKPVSNGPVSVGFDYYFGISASLDMVPYTFIENDRVAALPTVEKSFPLHEGWGEKRSRSGPAAPDFEASKVQPELIRRAVEYIEQRSVRAGGKAPFFLYLPLASPHTPIVPNVEWRRRSGMNAYADFVMEVDAGLGRILDALERTEAADATIVIFTSDNGCSPEADIPGLAAMGHAVSGPWRGHKADIYEGGHRVPFIVRWPGTIQPGRVCEHLTSQVDIFATLAEVVDASVPADAAEDSMSFLGILKSPDGPPVRQRLVVQSISGAFGLRDGAWKLALCPGSGGWSAPRDAAARAKGLPEDQLYDLGADPAEVSNLVAKHSERVKEMTQWLEHIIREGRSTPGPRQANAVPVHIRKSELEAPKSQR
jgi:arylsulfatase A-like enzyme